MKELVNSTASEYGFIQQPENAQPNWSELARQIGRHYQVEADLAWIEGLSTAAAKSYLIDNVGEFLREYVFRQPWGVKQYGPNFTLPGSRKSLLDSLWRTVELAAGREAKIQARLKAELAGMEAINRWLDQNPDGLALWVVPPSPTPDFAPYGFLYLARRSGAGLQVDWFRYEAQLATVETVITASHQLWRQLAGRKPVDEEVAAIISQPILVTKSGEQPQLDQVRQWLAKAGLSLPPVNPHQEEILMELGPFIAAYADLLLQLRRPPAVSELQRAKELLAKIYYQARSGVEVEPEGVIWVSPVRLQGSCPVVGLTPVALADEGRVTIFQRLQQRQPEEEQRPAEGDRCPRCGHRLVDGRCLVCGWPGD